MTHVIERADLLAYLRGNRWLAQNREVCYNDANHIPNAPALLVTAGGVSQDGVSVMTDPIVSPETPQLKRCSRCGELKPHDVFGRHRRSPDGLQAWCRACRQEYNKANKEHIRQRHRKYMETYKVEKADHLRNYRLSRAEEKAEYLREWRAANRDHLRNLNRDWRIENADHIREYKEVNAQHIRETRRKWRVNNPDKVRASSSRRRARKRNAPGVGMSSEDLAALRAGQSDRLGRVRCWWCGCVIPDNKWHIDHRIALDRGGAHEPGNICLSCPDCNLSKHTKTPGEFAGRLL